LLSITSTYWRTIPAETLSTTPGAIAVHQWWLSEPVFESTGTPVSVLPGPNVIVVPPVGSSPMLGAFAGSFCSR